VLFLDSGDILELQSKDEACSSEGGGAAGGAGGRGWGSLILYSGQDQNGRQSDINKERKLVLHPPPPPLAHGAGGGDGFRVRTPMFTVSEALVYWGLGNVSISLYATQYRLRFWVS